MPRMRRPALGAASRMVASSGAEAAQAALTSSKVLQRGAFLSSVPCSAASQRQPSRTWMSAS